MYNKMGWITIIAGIVMPCIFFTAYADQIQYRLPTSSAGNNLTLLQSNGGLYDGSNDIHMTWDGTIFTSSDDYIGPGSISNMTLSSDEPLFGNAWAAHDAQVFGPGEYEFDVSLGGDIFETGSMTLIVGENQLGAHVLINFLGYDNIDVVVLWNMDDTFSLQDQQTPVPSCINCLWSGADNGIDYRGGILDGSLNTADTVFTLVSVDGSGDGIPGTPLSSGNPFAGIHPNFNLNFPPPVIPILVDIKPGSDLNIINVSSSGVIPVAILSTDIFDANTVDPSTVCLAGASVKLVGKSEKELCHFEDVNMDGQDDLVCQVYTAQFMVEEGETSAILEAYNFDGMKLRGEDSVRIVPDTQ